jgi:hypothetical protein
MENVCERNKVVGALPLVTVFWPGLVDDIGNVHWQLIIEETQ